MTWDGMSETVIVGRRLCRPRRQSQYLAGRRIQLAAGQFPACRAFAGFNDGRHRFDIQRMERTQAGLAAARRAGRTGGRPPRLTEDDLEAARALLANPNIGVTRIAHRLGVSPATLDRYYPRGANRECAVRLSY
jgi:hypothetical protein